MTQKAIIIRHLRKYGSISPHEAAMSYGITRLAARIFELKEDGYQIHVERKVHKMTRKQYVKYSFEGEQA